MTTCYHCDVALSLAIVFGRRGVAGRRSALLCRRESPIIAESRRSSPRKIARLTRPLLNTSIPHPATSNAIRAWWTSSTRKDADH